MHTTPSDIVSVKFNGQRATDRTRFSWILPRSQRKFRVEVADVLLFEVILPKYGTRKDEYHQNCERFLQSVASGKLQTNGVDSNTEAIATPASATSKPWDPFYFYLRGRKIGSGSYGDVETVLRMPDGKVFAAKRFKSKDSFEQEVRMLKKVCETPHVSTNRCSADSTITD